MESIVDAVDQMIRGGNVSAVFAPAINNNNNSDNNGSNNSFVLKSTPEDYARGGLLKQVIF